MKPVRMILVGGFLGSGKTTLVARAAEALIARGMRVGLITNDQASNLVDTELLRQAGFGVREVAGSCFCCGLNKLVDSAEQLIKEFQPDLLLAEPVGSCADLSATVIQPIKKYCAGRIEPARFSVLADPDRLAEALTGEIGPALRDTDEATVFPRNVLYIFRKQLEEADLVVLNKTDTLADRAGESLRRRAAEALGGKEVLMMSALEGGGVQAWLDRVLAEGPVGETILDIDYDRYADGEAALGWLNARVHVLSDGSADWRAYCADLLEHLRGSFQARQAEIGHVKILLTSPGGSLAGNVTANAGRLQLRGGVPDGVDRAELIVNARVNLAPGELQSVVEAGLASAGGDAVRYDLAEIASFEPAPPNPTCRIDHVL